MKNIFEEISKVRHILTECEINNLLDYLIELKCKSFVNNISKKKKAISDYLEEKTYVDILTAKGVGKIKIHYVTLPPYELLPYFPKFKHPYFVNRNWEQRVVKEEHLLNYHIPAYFYPVICFDNKSNYSLNKGDIFYIKKEKFILIVDSLAFKLKHIGKYQEPDIAIAYGWLNNLIA